METARAPDRPVPSPRRYAWRTLALLALYLSAYLGYRRLHRTIREPEGVPEVVFPVDDRLSWIFFRPCTRLDAALTGMRFHIGPHPAPPPAPASAPAP